MLKKLIVGIAILAASLGYGCVAHAQTPCTGGQCQVQQTTYATPVRNAVYATAQAVTQATAPKQCNGERRQPVRDAIRKVLGGKCK
jgi:hypothetical protein